MLARNKGWFGSGSKIIITTRDQQLLIRHDVDIQDLAGEQRSAISLYTCLIKKPCKKTELEEDYLELSKLFVKYWLGHPLALKI